MNKYAKFYTRGFNKLAADPSDSLLTRSGNDSENKWQLSGVRPNESFGGQTRLQINNTVTKKLPPNSLNVNAHGGSYGRFGYRYAPEIENGDYGKKIFPSWLQAKIDKLNHAKKLPNDPIKTVYSQSCNGGRCFPNDLAQEFKRITAVRANDGLLKFKAVFPDNIIMTPPGNLTNMFQSVPSMALSAPNKLSAVLNRSINNIEQNVLKPSQRFFGFSTKRETPVAEMQWYRRFQEVGEPEGLSGPAPRYVKMGPITDNKIFNQMISADKTPADRAQARFDMKNIMGKPVN